MIQIIEFLEILVTYQVCNDIFYIYFCIKTKTFIGLDFAWSANGYVYHTKFDSIDQLPLGSLQRTGDNILSLAQGMAQGHQLSDIENHKAGNLVFFDFLGAFVVRWPMMVSDIINILSVIFSVYTIIENSKENKDGMFSN